MNTYIYLNTPSELLRKLMSHGEKNIHKELKKLPLNLRKQARRELRNRNELHLAQNPKKRHRKSKKSTAEQPECDALLQETETALRKLLENNEVLSDIPYDVQPEELLGEIAIAKGHATTIFVEREGLSTLTIVLPQEQPTIADLKRAIAVYSRAQLKREQRMRYEERIQRRRQHEASNGAKQYNDDRQSIPANTHTNTNNFSNNNNKTHTKGSSISSVEAPQCTGELVCSATRTGHVHRSNVSWRFLWRAYALYNLNTKQPIDDTNGRKLLSELGIENAATLKFNQREKYFGRKRQK